MCLQIEESSFGLFFVNFCLHSFFFNCACLLYYKSWLIWMLFCSILRFLFNTVSGKAISFLSFILPKPDSHGKSLPRGGNLTFSRSLGVGNLTLASIKMSNSPRSAWPPPPPSPWGLTLIGVLLCKNLSSSIHGRWPHPHHVTLYDNKLLYFVPCYLQLMFTEMLLHETDETAC